MKIEKLSIAYFSPTLSTKRLALHVAWGMGLHVPTQQINLTSVKSREEEYLLGPDDLLLFTAPTYGGRLPHVTPGLMENIKGNGTPAVAVVVYGERGYDDTLLEMKDNLEQNGFMVIGAAALIAEHALVPKVGAGRPDQKDIEETIQFGKRLRQKLDSIDSQRMEEYTLTEVPGNSPYKDLPGGPPMAPITTDQCVLCMQCHRWCPTNSILYNDPNTTEVEKCIHCQGCVKRCPTQARVLDNETIRARILATEGMFADVHHDIEVFL